MLESLQVSPPGCACRVFGMRHKILRRGVFEIKAGVRLEAQMLTYLDGSAGIRIGLLMTIA